MHRIKTIRSHVGHARFLGECERSLADPELNHIVGFLPHHRLPALSPYHYAPSFAVYRHGDDNVLVLETSHKNYEVWSIDARDLYSTEERATDEYIRSLRAPIASNPIRHAGR
jgi:hypothetical protein